MLARLILKGTRAATSLLLGGVALLAACGTPAAQGSDGDPVVYERSFTNRISAGSSSIDYDTTRHLGLLITGVGTFSLDYDTRQHISGRQMR